MRIFPKPPRSAVRPSTTKSHKTGISLTACGCRWCKRLLVLRKEQELEERRVAEREEREKKGKLRK
jgi:hypothetical protein